jgi:hypothetical protein
MGGPHMKQAMRVSQSASCCIGFPARLASGKQLLTAVGRTSAVVSAAQGLALDSTRLS